MIDSENLAVVLETVNDEYYGKFRPNQDRLLLLALNGQIYDGAGKEIAKLSVPALDSILLLADEAMRQMVRENQLNMRSGYISFVEGLLQLLVIILVVLFIPAYLKTKLIKPLNALVDLIESLGFGNTDIMVPYLQRMMKSAS